MRRSISRKFYLLVCSVFCAALLSSLNAHSDPFWRSFVPEAESYVDYFLDMSNPFEFYNSWILGVPHHELAPRDFFRRSGDGEIVGVNGVTGWELYQKTSDYMAGAAFTEIEGNHFSRVADPSDMINYLLEIYENHGPINKLIIVGHGIPGAINLGGTFFSPSWVEENAKWLESLPVDLFTPNAKVVLISCDVGIGFFPMPDYGVHALEQMFSPLLGQGGMVVASRRYVNPDLSQVPREYKTNSDRFFRYFAGMSIQVNSVINWIISDWTSKLEKVVEVEINP